MGEQYVRDYTRGWAASGRGTDSREYMNGSTDAFEAGYVDRATDQPKWTRAYGTPAEAGIPPVTASPTPRTPTIHPQLVEVPEPGESRELSGMPLFDGDPAAAWRTLAPGEYLATGGIAVGTDDEWLEDAVLTVTASESSVQWARHRMDDEATPGVCRCGAAGAPSVIHFG
jgi:hypothetical protein